MQPTGRGGPKSRSGAGLREAKLWKRLIGAGGRLIACS
jgi:hypothetical protein